MLRPYSAPEAAKLLPTVARLKNAQKRRARPYKHAGIGCARKRRTLSIPRSGRPRVQRPAGTRLTRRPRSERIRAVAEGARGLLFRLMLAAVSADQQRFRGWRRSPGRGAAPVPRSPAEAVIGPETKNVREARRPTSSHRAHRRSLSIRSRRIALIRLRCPWPFALSQARTSLSMRNEIWDLRGR